MKKNHKYIVILSVVFFALLTSCEDNLDVLPKNEIAAEEALVTVNDHQIALNAAYTALIDNDYYGRTFVAIADHSSDNGIVPSGAGARLNDNYTLAINAANTALGTWDMIYDMISRANNVINSIRELESGTQEERNRILGEALFLRALGHHDLSRLFAHDYFFEDDSSHPAVPYVFVTQIAEPARDPMDVFYGYLLEDLDESIALLTNNNRSGSDAPNFASVWAAKALRARVKLYRSDFGGALVDADDVINNGPYSLTTYIVTDDMGDTLFNQIGSWSDRNPTSESIFEVEADQLDDLFPGLEGLASIYQRDAGYGDAGPSQDIIALYTANDVRSNWYINDSGIDFVNKYPGQGGNSLFFTVPVLRLTEMYLIKAEAHAEANQDNEARQAINLIAERANAPDITSSGNQLDADIQEERRRELAFEGHRYYDLKRLQQDIIRNDCSLIQNCVVPYGDRLFAYPIPIEETATNENMRQNPGY